MRGTLGRIASKLRSLLRKLPFFIFPGYRPPRLSDDILSQIFVKCHPKTVGRLRALNSVSTYAFGFLPDFLEYRVVYFFKNDFLDTEMQWLMWNSTYGTWNQHVIFDTEVQKIGPTLVIDMGVAYFVGWEVLIFIHPTSWNIYILPNTLARKLQSHNQDFLLFVDDSDNCVPIRFRRENRVSIIHMSHDVRRFRNLSEYHPIVHIAIRYFN
ncbi:hypothetical protein PIB30_078017 [Stylosanthes scabra]|uniref:Uncharacterized protein n=1 Tax=Stylosanthes scabra TaxID=79078 RepID=A0ABU6TQ89_9FABA|nr:hypothetical protein [Stylosanthes scabra]